MNLRLGLAMVVVMATAMHTMGCTGLMGCGVGPSEGPNNQNGTVMFPSVPVGKTEDLTIPFQDSNPNAAETLAGATFSGPDAAAFQVITTFPVPIAPGAQVSLQIRFSPTHTGSAAATLVLDTEEMGPSPVQLQGTGE